MAGPHISQLEIANGPNKVGISNAGGVQEYKVLDPIDFLVGTDIEIKGMSYADVVAGVAPAVTATPPSDPANPGRNTVLRRRYNNLFRTWKYDGVAWSHVYDEAIRNVNHIELTIVESHLPVPGGLNFPYGEFFVVPAYMNGAVMTEMTSVANSGAGSVVLSLFVNGIGVACFGAFTSSVPSTVVCAPLTIFANDILTFEVNGLIGALNGATVTLVYRLP